MEVRSLKGIVLVLFLSLQLLNCGVKGDPLPPERPAELGRGRPTYRRAAERVKVIPQSTEEIEQDEEVDDESEGEL